MAHNASSPKSRHGSPTSRGGIATPMTPSFFIIQEPPVIVQSSPIDTQKTAATVALTSSRGELEKHRHALASRQSQSSTYSLSSGTPGPRRHRPRVSTGHDTPAILHEETEHDLLVDNEEEERETSTDSTPKPRVLTILNRVGSSPDLPLHNSWSSTVFMPSKKRQLLKPSHGTGASPHLAAIQRSRLIPLPINIRTGTLKKNEIDDDMEPPGLDRTTPLGMLPNARLVQTKGFNDEADKTVNYEITITSLKQRLAIMEKASSKALKLRQALEKQIDVLTTEQHALHSERTQLQKKLQDLEATNLHQRNMLDKLSERFSAVYSNLAKMAEVAGSKGDLPHHVASMQLAILTMARENQELQRKLQVLETRHAEDKVVVTNQDKQIKRLRAEMEALQHMAGSKDENGDLKTSDFNVGSSSKAPMSRPEITSSQSQSIVTTQVTTTTTQPQSEEASYIDPNILKVLEKVDSQFSITSAITLSAVMKKWLHSCLHIVASTDLHGVLHVLLKRVCELLHCQHAAVFHVDHSAKNLIGVASERGLVRWEMPLEKGILGHAARYNLLCNVRKAYDDPRFFSSSDTITGTKSREVLCIPLTRELDAFQPDPTSTSSTTSVFAVLQCWNTTSQKPFTQNDQILGCLLAVHAGIVLSQTKLSDNLQRVHNRVLQISYMDDELAPKAFVRHESTSEAATSVSIVHLVRAAQRKLAEVIGITKLRIYILDSDVMQIWHVGAAKLEVSDMSNEMQLMPIRKYAHVHSSLCGLLLDKGLGAHKSEHYPGDGPNTTDCQILLEPSAEPTFNDTVDLKGGAHGLYMAAIRSPWRELPLGMIQVARTGTAFGHSLDSRPMSTATKKERQHAQAVDDELTMELIQLFCRQFASLLHHALALQLRDACPEEVLNARLSYLTDRLDFLESEYLREQEEAEAEAAVMAQQAHEYAAFERRLLESAQNPERRLAKPVTPTYNERQLHGGDAMVFDPVPLISTDSSYAIDLLGASNSSPDGSNEDANVTPNEGDNSSLSSLSPSDIQTF